MKLKRIISCGLVGILSGVGILMNVKVSNAEDKSVIFDANCLDGFKNVYDVYEDNKTGFFFEVDKGFQNKGVQLNKGKGLGVLFNKKSFGDIQKIDISVSTTKDFDLYIAKDGNYSSSISYTKFKSSSSSITVDLSDNEENIGFFKIQVSGCVVFTNITITYSEASSNSVSFYDGETELTDLACKVEENGKITKPVDPVKEGYVFDAWYKDEGFNTPWDFENDTVSQDTKLYAKFLPEAEVTKYNVTFKSDENTVINTVTVKDENSIGKPDDPTKDGYQFAGWYKDINCTEEYDFNTKVTADLTLYAKWNAEYTVSFDTNGAGVISSQTVVSGGYATKPAKDPVKKGFNFDGWYTDNTYTTPFDFENTKITDNTTIYANFIDSSVFELNGYTFNKISTLEELTTGYYVIGGYNANANTNYYMGEIDGDIFGANLAYKNYYGIKAEKGKLFIQDVNANYVNIVSEKKVELSKNKKTYFEPKVVNDEFQFVIDDNLSFQFNPSSPRFTAYKITSKLGNLVLYKAKNVTPINVTYKNPEGNVFSQDEVLPKQKPINLQGQTLSGYKFVGWCKEGTDTLYDFNAELTEDIVLVAKYEAMDAYDLFKELQIKNQLAYHWSTEDGKDYTIDNVSLRFGVNLTEEMKNLEGVKFGAFVAKASDVDDDLITCISLAENAKSAADVVKELETFNVKYLEFTNIAAEGGMTSLRIDNLDNALNEKMVVVIYMEYNGELYLTEQCIASVRDVAVMYLQSKDELGLDENQIDSLNRITKSNQAN